jgi:glutathione peroxidase
MTNQIYQYKAETGEGREISLSDYSGKVLLIVNTASKCGFTPQLEGLQSLYDDYQNQGFEILAFPCNQFMGQEPLNDAEIQEFCSLTYQTTFPLMKKINVNGKHAHELFRYLKKELPGMLGIGLIKWNFTKFLIDRNGQAIKRYEPNTKPSELRTDIESLLKT